MAYRIEMNPSTDSKLQTGYKWTGAPAGVVPYELRIYCCTGSVS